MATPPFLFSERPELEQNLLRRLRGFETRRYARLGQEEGAAKGEALARGFEGQPIEASLRLGARQAAEADIQDYLSSLTGQAISLEEAERGRQFAREERLGGEAFRRGERLGGEAFAGEQARLGREFETGERLGREKFVAGESALERALRERLQAKEQEFGAKQAEYERGEAAFQEKQGRRTSKTKTIIEAVAGGLGSIFCFAGDTLIDMADGSRVAIRFLMPRDKTKGGMVLSTRVAVSNGEIYNYNDVFVTGSHAVKENGVWIRVKDSKLAEKSMLHGTFIYSLVTSNHRIFSNGIEFADEAEHDESENLTADQSLARLNEKEREYAKAV